MFNRQNGSLFLIGNDSTGSQNLMHYIEAKSYKAVRTPLEKSYRDANGGLHRNVVSNVPVKVEFKTLAGMTDTQMEQAWGAVIRNSFTVANERKVNAMFWVPEINDYYSSDYYVVDPEFTIREIKKNSNGEYEVIYESVTFKFIGY